MGVETAVASYQPISYGFLSLFCFPLIFGTSVYSLSKYDEYLSSKLIVTTLEKSGLKTTLPTKTKKQLENRAINNPIENFVMDTMALIKGDLRQAEKVGSTNRLLKVGAISLLLAGGTSLVLLDIVKNTSSRISPAQAESVIDIEHTKISLSINEKDNHGTKISYISSSLGSNDIQNNYNPYRISDRNNTKETYISIAFV